MSHLQLHFEGENNYKAELQKELDKQIKLINASTTLSPAEKKDEIAKLKSAFDTQIKNAQDGLF